MLSLKHYKFVTKQNPVPYFFNQRPTMRDRLVTWSVQIDRFLSVTSCLCWQIWSGLGSGGKRWHHILLYMPNFECWSLSKHQHQSSHPDMFWSMEKYFNTVFPHKIFKKGAGSTFTLNPSLRNFGSINQTWCPTHHHCLTQLYESRKKKQKTPQKTPKNIGKIQP